MMNKLFSIYVLVNNSNVSLQEQIDSLKAYIDHRDAAYKTMERNYQKCFELARDRLSQLNKLQDKYVVQKLLSLL